MTPMQATQRAEELQRDYIQACRLVAMATLIAIDAQHEDWAEFEVVRCHSRRNLAYTAFDVALERLRGLGLDDVAVALHRTAIQNADIGESRIFADGMKSVGTTVRLLEVA